MKRIWISFALATALAACGEGGGGAAGAGGSGEACDAACQALAASCERTCEFRYETCDGTFLDEGVPVAREGCAAFCSRAFDLEQSDCLGVTCALAESYRCLGEEPHERCEAACANFHGCGYAFRKDEGGHYDEAGCREICSAGMPLYQSACIANAACADMADCF